ncbi:MAG: hypothetical protein JRG94_25935, partial [Deltaproteobacteria bacterium]|nr:hypothetical protein [Deltaproteobacteria bacterium]
WLCFDAAYRGPLRADWSLLAVSGRLEAALKLVRSGADDSVRVRAELPITTASGLHSQLKGIRRGYEHAIGAGLAVGVSTPPVPEVVIEGSRGLKSQEAEARSSELAALCDLAHQSFTPRSESHGVVDLVAGPGFWQTEIRRVAGAELWLRTSIDDPDTGASAAALARLLLRASGTLRLVRATAGATDAAHREPAFEVRLTRGEAGERADAEAERLVDAVGAIAAACRYVGDEARLIAGSESLARAYFEPSRGSDRKLNQSAAHMKKRGTQTSPRQDLATSQPG